MTNGNESRLDRVEHLLDRLAEQNDAANRRMDRMEERHQALSETVEIIAGMQRENEAIHRKNEELMTRALEAIHSLARIAEAHEHRLDNLENQ